MAVNHLPPAYHRAFDGGFMVGVWLSGGKWKMACDVVWGISHRQTRRKINPTIACWMSGCPFLILIGNALRPEK